MTNRLQLYGIMRLLLVMGPVETVVPARDTSLALLVAARARGHDVHHCVASGVSLVGGTLHARTCPAVPDECHRNGIALAPPATRPLSAFDAVFVRTDPPFDHDYLTLTLLLEHARQDVVIVNDPRGLRDANEKLYALRFPELTPATLVTADQDAIVAFIADHDGAVVKPVDGHGGAGVVALLPGDRNTNSVLETATLRGRRIVVVQQYLPAVISGDKRILLLDGEPLGAILRVPTEDDFRATVARGEVRAAGLSAADRRIVETLGPSLRRDGLWFVGIDVVDGHLTEVNVTSPTGLRHLAALSGTDPAGKVIVALEAMVEAHAANREAHP